MWSLAVKTWAAANQITLHSNMPQEKNVNEKKKQTPPYTRKTIIWDFLTRSLQGWYFQRLAVIYEPWWGKKTKWMSGNSYRNDLPVLLTVGHTNKRTKTNIFTLQTFSNCYLPLPFHLLPPKSLRAFIIIRACGPHAHEYVRVCVCGFLREKHQLLGVTLC